MLPCLLPRRARPALALAALAACSDLSPIEVDTCGNRVIEAAVSEECDGQATCGAPGTPHACRYLCDPEAETSACPEAYGCGADGVCRRHSGGFEQPSAISAETTLGLLAGDINGDGCADVVRSTLQGSVVSAFASRFSERCAASEQTLTTSRLEEGQELYPAPLLVSLLDSRRMDLVTAGRGLLGDGLFMYLAGDSPPLIPALYASARLEEPDVTSLKVRRHGGDALLLVLSGGQGTPPGGKLALVTDPAEAPRSLPGTLPAGAGAIVALAAADLDGAGVAEGKPCDEVAMAFSGETQVRLVRLCGPGDELTFAPLDSPAVELGGGAHLRESRAALALIDKDGDGLLDLLVNTAEGDIHVAYGLGDGRFHSSPPPFASPDQRTSPLWIDDEGLRAALGDEHSAFVAGDFDASQPGAELAPIACPEATPFGSPLCAPMEGACEALVADVDADGDPDVVATEGQQPEVIVYRNSAEGGFVVDRLETQCPPRHLSAGDVDGDDITDISFFDQVAPSLDNAITALTVAYGSAFAAPHPPRTQGVLVDAVGLAAGDFVAGVAGDQLLAVRKLGSGTPGEEGRSGLALVEGQSGRGLVAPFYFPATPQAGPGGSSSNIVQVTLQAATTGRFRPGDPAAGAGGGGERPPDDTGLLSSLAVIAENSGQSGMGQLWLVQGDKSQGTVRPPDPGAAVAASCDGCLLVPVRNGEQGADDLLLLGDGEIVVYRPGDAGSGEATGADFVEVFRLGTAHTFRSIHASPSRATYTPRPVTLDVDGDAAVDVVIARSSEGALVALFRDGDGFREAPLDVDCQGEDGAGCRDLSFAALNADGDAAKELVIAGPGSFGFYNLDVAGRKLVPLPEEAGRAIKKPPADTDFTALAAADVDGDGVDDVVHMPSSTFLVIFRGIPAVE